MAATLIAIPINLMIDLTSSVTKWSVYKCYQWGKYLIWGNSKSPEMLKLEAIENSLNHFDLKTTEEMSRYQEIIQENLYPLDTWLVIQNLEVIYHTTSKADALEMISEHETRCLLIQIGHENKAMMIYYN